MKTNHIACNDTINLIFYYGSGNQFRSNRWKISQRFLFYFCTISLKFKYLEKNTKITRRLITPKRRPICRRRRQKTKTHIGYRARNEKNLQLRKIFIAFKQFAVVVCVLILLLLSLNRV